MLCKLEYSALTVGTGGDRYNVRWVLDRSNYAGGEDDLLPGFADVDNVDALTDQKKDRRKLYDITRENQQYLENYTHRLASASRHKAPLQFRSFWCQCGSGHSAIG